MSTGIAELIDDKRSVRQPTSAELQVEATAILADIAAQQAANEKAEADRRAQLEAIPKSEAQLAKMAARKAKAEEEERRRKAAAEAADAAAAAAGVAGRGAGAGMRSLAWPKTRESANSGASRGHTAHLGRRELVRPRPVAAPL